MKNLLVLFILSVGICFTACKSEEEDSGETMSLIADDFTVVGLWNFQTVEATGQVEGIDSEDKDNNPSGYVQFNDDGTGVFDFGINLLATDYGKLDSITWTRESNELVRIIESDGDINDWTLIRANESLVEASWDITVTDNSFATFTAVLTAE